MTTPTTRHFQFLRLHITQFNEICAHHPPNVRWFKLRRIDMQKANGPQCKTLRLWVYFKKHSYLIDWYARCTVSGTFTVEEK